MKIKRLISVFLSVIMLTGACPEIYVSAETTVPSNDEGALTGGKFAFDLSKNIYIDADTEHKTQTQYDSATGVLTATMPADVASTVILNVQDQMISKSVSTPKMKYARLSYYMKLTASDLYKFGNKLGAVHSLYSDKTFSTNSIINPQYMDFDDNGKRHLFYNLRDKKGNIGFWEPGTQNPELLDTRKWTHVEYWMDLTGTNVTLYVKVGDQDLRGPVEIKDVPVGNIVGFGRLDFGSVKDICDGKIEIKDVWYSWGDYAEDLGVYEEQEFVKEEDKGALSGGQYAFDLTKRDNIYTSDSKIKTTYSSETGVLTISTPSASNSDVVLNVQDQMKTNNINTTKMKYARLSYYMKLTANDLYKFGNKLGAVHSLYSDKTFSAEPIIHPQYMDFDDNGKRHLFYNLRDKKGNIGFWEPGTQNPELLDTRKWTHVEYWMDLTGTNVTLYVKVGDQDLRGPVEIKDVPVGNIVGFGRLDFGSVKDICDGVIEVKNIWYSWGDYAEDLGVFEEQEMKADEDECALKGGKYLFDLTKKNNIYTSDSKIKTTYSSETGVLTISTPSASNSDVVLNVQDQMKDNSVSTPKMKYARLSYYMKLTADDLYKFGNRLGAVHSLYSDKTFSTDPIIHPQYLSFDDNGKRHLFYNLKDKSGNIGFWEPGTAYSDVQDTRKWTHVEFWMDLTGTNVQLYVRVGDQNVRGPVEIKDVPVGNIVGFGRLDFGSVKDICDGVIEVKNIWYSWGDTLTFSAEEQETVKDAIGLEDETGTQLYSLTKGNSVTAYYDPSKIGANTAVVLYTPEGEAEQTLNFESGQSTYTFTPDKPGKVEIRLLNESSKTVDSKIIKVYNPIDANFDLLANKGKLKVAYLGGSITEGAGCKTDVSKRWSSQITNWLNSLNIGTTFEEINAGIGGTPSTYGLMRLERDVISKKPDIVFVEFALNDEELGETESAKAYEGIIRKLMEMEKKPYVVCVGVVGNRTKKTRASLHREIASLYGLQFIDIQEFMDNKMGTASPGINNGRDALFNDDNTHPNEEGYTFYADYLKTQINTGSFNKPQAETPYGDYFDCDGRFINAVSLTRTGDWTVYGSGDWSQKHLGNNGSGTASNSSNAEITYEFTGKTFILGHRYNSNSGTAVITIDGVPEEVSFKGDNATWHHVSWYRKFDLENKKHTVSVKPKGDGEIKIDFVVVSKDNPELEFPEDMDPNVFTANPDRFALKGGSHAFDFTQTDVWINNPNITSHYTSKTGVLKVDIPKEVKGDIILNVQDQLKRNNVDTKKMKWARLSYYMKLTADDLYAFGNHCGSAHTLDSERKFSTDPIIDPKYMSFTDESGSGKRYLYYNLKDKTGTIGYWEPGTQNSDEMNTREWTHVEYWMDLTGDTVQLYVRVGDKDVRGPVDTDVPVGDIIGFARLDFGTEKNISAATLEIKDIWYSWGDSVKWEDSDALMSFTDEYGVNISSVTVGNTILAQYTVKEDEEPVKPIIVYTYEGGGEKTLEFEDGKTILPITPDKPGRIEMRILGESSEVLKCCPIDVYEPISSNFDLLANKGTMKVAYLGGSITEGTGCHTDMKKRWSTQITAWLNSLNLGTEFKEINAGVGGTPSTYGLMRLERDVISKEPDIVFVEFAVNDEELGETESARAYEGIIHKLMEMEKKPYVICVGVVANRTSRTRASLHRKIAEKYGLQFIDIQEYMDARLGDGKPGENPQRDELYYDVTANRVDEVHPNEKGYTFYTEYLKSQINTGSFNKPYSETTYGNYFDCDGKFINAIDLERSGDWTEYGAGDWSKMHLGNAGSGIATKDTSAAIAFSFSGKTFVLGHRFNSEAGTAIITIDGIPEEISFNGDNATWHHVSWYRKYDLEDKEHTVTIRPMGDGEIRIDFVVVSKDSTVSRIMDEPLEPEQKAVWGNYSYLRPNYIDENNLTYTPYEEDNYVVLEKKLKPTGAFNYNLYEKMPQKVENKEGGKVTGVRNVKWNKIEFDVKLSSESSVFAKCLGILKSGIKESDGNAITHVTASYEKKSDGSKYLVFKSGANATYAEVKLLHEITEYTHISYWIYHQNVGSDLLYIGVDKNIVGPFEVGFRPIVKMAAGSTLWNTMFFSVAGDGVGDKIYIKNMNLYGGDVCPDFDASVMIDVENSTITDNAENVEISEGDIVSAIIKFNHKLKAGTAKKPIDYKKYILVLGGKVNDDALEVSKVDDYSLKVTINNAEPRTEYKLFVRSSIPYDESQTDDKGVKIVSMDYPYELTFTTWPAPFEVSDVVIGDNPDKNLSDYKGENIDVKVNFANNRIDDCQDGYVYVAITDEDGMMYKLEIQPFGQLNLGTDTNVTVNIDVPEGDKQYHLETYATSGLGTGIEGLLPLCKKTTVE